MGTLKLTFTLAMMDNLGIDIDDVTTAAIDATYDCLPTMTLATTLVSLSEVQQLNTTQAYIETLNKEQLQEFASKLELKTEEFAVEENGKVKTLHI